MKRSSFTDSQIIETLKRAEAGLAIPELCQELGIRLRPLARLLRLFTRLRARPQPTNGLMA